MKRNLIYAFLIVFVTSAAVLGQKDQIPITSPRKVAEAENHLWNRELEKRTQDPFGGRVEVSFGQLRSRQKEAIKRLQPDKEEQKLYADFLKQPRTGLIRLATEISCYVVDIKELKSNDPCLNLLIPGKGAAYSFRHKDYVLESHADLQRAGNEFAVSGSFILGLMTSLGDVPIASVTRQSEAVSAVLQFSPSNRLDDIQKQEKDLTGGITISNVAFKKKLPIQENTTYLLRSIACSAKVKTASGANEKEVLLGGEKRYDVIVAFRVLKIHSDNSISLLWKEIHQQKSPIVEIKQVN